MNQHEVEVSIECRACLDAWNRINELGIPDNQGSERDAAFAGAVEAFVDCCPTMPAQQRLGELNLIWHLDAWQGDIRIGLTRLSDDIERMIAVTIEEISGIPRMPASVRAHYEQINQMFMVAGSDV